MEADLSGSREDLEVVEVVKSIPERRIGVVSHHEDHQSG